MVKGLMSQLMTKVSNKPCGRWPTPFTACQSIWIIIG